eukprot:COSAG01_NODE_216_length_21695_cov_83.368772_2_plen_490_part_00
MNKIKFGTSGYRGIINDTFKKEDVKKICLAIAQVMKEKYSNPTLALAYDPREGNDPLLAKNSFTKTIVDTLTQSGINLHFFTDYTPTPFLSWYVPKKKLQGGIILTASHNPAEYNGLKFNPENGAPSPVQITQAIENYLQTSLDTETTQPLGKVKKIKPDWASFAKDMQNNLIQLGMNLPEKLSLHAIVDCKHGTASKNWKALFKIFNLTHYDLLHEKALSDFNHIETNPCHIPSLDKLKTQIKQQNAKLGIANDPDADRHILLDENGNALSPEETALVILDFFISQNIACHGLISTLASSAILKTACNTQHINYEECNVGFKYIAEKLESYKNNHKTAFGIESSGGFSATFHTLEKCGFLPAILILIAIEKEQKPLSKLKEKVIKKYGTFYFKESQFKFQASKKKSLNNNLKNIDIRKLQPSFKKIISHTNKNDGLKICFSNQSWALLRFSGTEPLIRIYTESKALTESQELSTESEKLLEKLLQNYN